MLPAREGEGVKQSVWPKALSLLQPVTVHVLVQRNSRLLLILRQVSCWTIIGAYKNGSLHPKWGGDSGNIKTFILFHMTLNLKLSPLISLLVSPLLTLDYIISVFHCKFDLIWSDFDSGRGINLNVSLSKF